MDRTEKEALCEIHALCGVGAATLWKAFHERGSFTQLYQANEADLYEILPPEAVNELIQRRRSRTSWIVLKELKPMAFRLFPY